MSGHRPWQVVDPDHSICAECGTIYANSDLLAGKCFGCRETDKDRRRNILAKADHKALATAAREFLSTLHREDKNSKRMSGVLDSFFQAAGGAEAFGKEIHRQWQNARGEDLTPEQLEDYNYSPKLILGWAELILRHQSREDESKTMDVSGLSEADLLASLSGLADDLIKHNPEWRRMAIEKAIKEDPSLINVALDAAGKPAIEAEAVQHNPLLHPDEADFEADPGAD